MQKAYNALKKEKSWGQMALIEGDIMAIAQIREAYFDALEGITAGEKNRSDSDIKLSVKEVDGKRIVIINGNILQGIPYSDIKKTIASYIKQHIGEYYTIIESGSSVYIGKDLSREYIYSKSTKNLRDADRKAKFKATPGIGEMIEIATNRRWEKPRHAEKHQKDAKYGFYKYTTAFAIPVRDNNGNIVRYNGYDADLVIRNDADGKKYLYDVINIQKSSSPRVAALSPKPSQNRPEPSGTNVSQKDTSVKNSIHDSSEKNAPKYSMKDSEGRTLTPEQAEFFKDSKIQDENGNLKVVYHHTNNRFTVFDRSRARTSMEMDGFFFAPENDPYNEYGEHVIKAYLNIKNPAINPSGSMA